MAVLSLRLVRYWKGQENFFCFESDAQTLAWLGATRRRHSKLASGTRSTRSSGSCRIFCVIVIVWPTVWPSGISGWRNADILSTLLDCYIR